MGAVSHQKQINRLNVLHLYSEHSINAGNQTPRILFQVQHVGRQCVNEYLFLAAVHCFDDKSAVERKEEETS